MDYKIGDNFSGFTLIETDELNEINSKGYLFVHIKSGGKLYFIHNDDDNKVFSISFRTPPKDSTGVAHILEHSVLCGSRKFKSKEPFVELIKGSLNTFLNAMTFPDKTMYPVASRNKKDFYNLMDVYLDAVFYPNIYNTPEILKQEGWHYEIESREEELTYKGVVYNEMKGAFSSPEGVLFRKIQESLFPDTVYGVESGGDPDFIPELTEEKFLEFHKNYYHPSNSYLYLYGDLEIEEALKFIDESYLSSFNKISVDSGIKLQSSFNDLKEKTYEYPISENEKEEDKTYLSLNYVTGISTESETVLALELLEYILLETPSAPLKKALIDAEIGKDVFGAFDSSIYQPVLNIVVKNSNEEKKEIFKKVTTDLLKKLVKEGIDKKIIEAAINIKEFGLREADFRGYPKGLVYNIKLMDSWLYDKSPKLHLRYENSLDRIKISLTTNYFEQLINKYILDNNHSSLVVIKPSKGLSEKKNKELKIKLAAYKSTLTTMEIDKLINDTKDLKVRQSEPDSQEALNSIPHLKLEDIDKETAPLPIFVSEINKVKLLEHRIFTNGILYFNMYFDVKIIQEEDLNYFALLVNILGNVSTKKYNYEELSNEININTGGIEFYSRCFTYKGNDEDYLPKLVVKGKVLEDKAQIMMELIHEIINSSNFDDKKRIKEIIQEIKSRLEMTILQSGHVVAANHAASYFSPVGVYEDLTKGLSFYKFISEIENNFQDNFQRLNDKLETISKLVFNKNNLILSVNCKDYDKEKFKDNFQNLFNGLSDENNSFRSISYNNKRLNEGLMTSADVLYVAKACNFKRIGYKYKGSMKVLKTISNYDYLWNNIRVKGGAYGVSSVFQRNGIMFLTSYRDPNLIETIRTYDNLADFIKNYQGDQDEITKYIIGTMSDIDSPLSPSMKGEEATQRYISGISDEDIALERKEILNTTAQDIRDFAPLIKDCMGANYLCVLGNEEKIRENKNLFNNIWNIFK